VKKNHEFKEVKLANPGARLTCSSSVPPSNPRKPDKYNLARKRRGGAVIMRVC
jgi:hypothetical protein